MKSNLLVLLARKSQKEGRRITLRRLSQDLEISKYTIYALANNDLNEFPRIVLEKLCTYFDCTLDDVFTVEEGERKDNEPPLHG